MDRAIDLVRPYAGEITLRGDTDFTLSAELDRWQGQGIKFIFGMDAHPKVVTLAQALPESAWKPLKRRPPYQIATEPRRKPKRVKEALVRSKAYLNKKLVGESVAQFDYQPHKCRRAYRLVVVRKNIRVQKGEVTLAEEVKYFFYLTNHTRYDAEAIVGLAHERCDQENVIEQLKNGVNAMRMPVDNLLEQRGLHAHERLGLESESLVRLAHAPSRTGRGSGPDGIPALFTCHRVAARPDRAQWPADHLPDPGLQRLVKGFVSGLGTAASDDACLNAVR